MVNLAALAAFIGDIYGSQIVIPVAAVFVILSIVLVILSFEFVFRRYI